MSFSTDFKSFNAKVLLFGEHVIVHGGLGLALPFPAKNAQFIQREKTSFTEDEKTFHAHCVKFATYVSTASFATRYNVSEFQELLDNGLTVQSSIPIGYGLGSSGAFVAAFYDAFCIDKKTALAEIKNDLAELECFFHGKSSGLDPIVSYLNTGVVLAGSAVQLVEKNPELAPLGLFLMDSTLPRSTEEFVELFKQKLQEEYFSKQIKEVIVPAVNVCIEAVLNQDKQTLLTHFEIISRFQLDNLKEFIPAHIQGLWYAGLETKTYFMKLCGAGGGGYFLGISTDASEVRQNTEKITWL